MKIMRDKLLNALKKCIPGVEKGDCILEGADTFAFSDGFVYSYNDNIAISVLVGEELKELNGAVKANEFFNTISKLPEKELSLSVKAEVWIIKSGKVRIEMTILEDTISEYLVDIQAVEKEWSDLPPKFSEALKSCKLSCNKTAFEGIFVNENAMVSTDGSRINWYTLSKKLPRFWINDSAASDLTKMGEFKKISVSDSWVFFEKEGGDFFFCRRLADSEFPFDKAKDLIKKHEKEKDDISGILPKAFQGGVDRASSFSMDMNDKEVVKVNIDSEGLNIYSERSSGKYREKIKWVEKPKGKFEPMVVYLDYDTVRYGISRSPNFYVKKFEKKDRTILRIVFYNENFKHIACLYSGE